MSKQRLSTREEIEARLPLDPVNHMPSPYTRGYNDGFADGKALRADLVAELIAALSRASDFLEANYSTEDIPDILPAVLAALKKAGA